MNTFGWDTVYTISNAKVNQALANNLNSLITTFDQPATDEFPVSAQGTFSKWEIVEGGSGQIVYLKLTVGSGTCTIDLDTTKTLDIASTTMVVAVQLQLLTEAAANVQDLKFDIQRVGEIGQPTTPGLITPVTLHDPSATLNDAEQALLMVAMSTYIANNAGQISYVFASINLVPPSSNSWLTPVQSRYVYANRIGTVGSLGILSVVSNRDIHSLPLQIDAVLVSTSFNAAYGISKELFLKNVIMPSLPTVFRHGTTPGSFRYDPSTSTIVNTANIPTDSVKEGAITYYPQITSLRMTTNGSGLANKFDGYCDMKAGIEMTFQVSTDNKSTFDPGSKSIGFLPDPHPISDSQSDIPWYYWFLGPIVRLIVELVVKLIKDGIAGTLSRDVGEKVSLARNPPTSIQWNETSSLDVRNAVVNEGFYMEGNL